VAVNPEDERYMNLSGAYVRLPVLNREIPLIFDKYVAKEFGTGALKITPAHDANDFEIGNRHDLERVKVIDESGRMNELAGPYKGMDRFECRERILEELRSSGRLEKVEPYRNAIGHCYRCKTVIEPLLSKQWFVRTAPLAEKAIQAVKEGRTRILPQNWEAVYYEWMNNIKDWCVSRQIWWGHRIPAWYCLTCGEVIVAKEEPAACPSCKGEALKQEEDVLDTWFSSALWPFSTLGWPDMTSELKTFYPTTAMVTAFDILFFWVARMMMMGIHFMGKVPFRDVYIHALVKDAEGKKMSKSKGNVIDPLEIIDQFGTDSFRFTLAALAAQGRDIKLSEDRILGYRHFVNKIWNSARLVFMNMGEGQPMPEEKVRYTLPDLWILTRFGQVSEEVAAALEEYRFNDAASVCYQFVWHEFCDWYLEMAKQGLYSPDDQFKGSTLFVLQKGLGALVRLLHPFMPFVTEEIWQKMPSVRESIMLADFPEPSEFLHDEAALKEMDLLMGVINGVRNIRGEMNIPPSGKVNIVVEAPDPKEASAIVGNLHHIRSLAGVEAMEVAPHVRKPEASATAVFEQKQVHVLLKGLLDFDEEKRRLRKEITKIEKDLDTFSRKLSNEQFLEKAPPEIVDEVRSKVEAMSHKREKLNHNLAFFEAIQ
jgi:valyl-tRNA synthetase